MTKKSPTARTMDYCRDRGWTPWVTEVHNTFSHKKKDLYGGIDMVVMDDQPGLLGIQATSGSNLGARVDKLNGLPLMVEWLKRGLRLEAWGWRKLKGRGRRQWFPKRMVATLCPMGEISWDDVEEKT